MSARIRRAEPGDREAILRIWDTEFGGADRRAAAWLDGTVRGAVEVATFVAVDGDLDADDGDPVGFIVAGICTPGYVADYVRGALSSDELDGETALVHVLCVDGDRQGEGIGTRLARTGLAWARGREGADLAVAVSWLREGRVDSAPLFCGLDFRRRSTIEGYYLGHRDDCPDCGGRCTCDAAVFAKAFDPR